MSGFLYFRSGDGRPLTKEGIAKLGLSYAFPAGIEGREVTRGLEGKAGYIFADPNRHTESIGYFPDRQTWRKLPKVEGRPELWVGYWNDAKPGPGDLGRGKMLRGIGLSLADGSVWQIPVVRCFDGENEKWVNELPAAWVDDGNGGLARGDVPTAKHVHLWDVTAPIADAMLAVAAGDEADWPEDSAVGRAVVALMQTNYVVGASELELLEAIGTEEAFAVVCAATRYDVLSDWMSQKKRTSDQSIASGVSTSDGAAA